MQGSREVRQRRGLSVIAGVSLVGAVTLSSFGALAQDRSATNTREQEQALNCRCLVARDSKALFREAKGSVLATQQTEFAPVQTNDTMRVPGRAVTGAWPSSAVIVLGERCEVEMKANETAEITAEEGRLCLRVVGEQGISPLVPLATLGVAGGIGGIIAGNGGDGGTPVFPVSR